ncbi:hypothetical protein HK098_001231 [Nowakowskiella sp. JEL0407]|nr:hypothetical protein HK098_001231 [Nowakowskiella sp. JEL0407]
MATKIQRTHLLNLPYIALDLIFYFLDDPGNLTLTCKFFHTMGEDPTLRLRWVQRDLKDMDMIFFNEIFYCVYYYDDVEQLENVYLVNRMPIVFQQILVNEAVCVRASTKSVLPPPILLATLFFSIEHHHREALINFTSQIEKHYAQLVESYEGCWFNGVPFEIMYSALLALMLLGAYTKYDTDLMRFYLKSDVARHFRQKLNTYFETGGVFSLPCLSPIIFAVSTNHAYFVEVLLDTFPSIINFKLDNFSPLLIASSKGNIAVVRAILSSEYFDINAASENRVTPLHAACMEYNDEILTLLLTKFNNLNIVDVNGRTPLHYCAMGDSWKCAEILLSHAPSVNVDFQDPKGHSPLHMAADSGSDRVLRLLVENNANLDLEDLEGRIPILLAVTCIDIGCVEFLLDQRPDQINYKSNRRPTPLTYAAMSFKSGSVDCLLGRGADISGFDVDLFLVTLKTEVRDDLQNDHLLDIFRSLLAYGFNPNTMSNFLLENDTVMHEACAIGNAALVELLLVCGGDGFSRNISGETPFSLASGNGHRQILEFIANGVSKEKALQIKNVTMERLKGAKYKPKFENFGKSKKRTFQEIVELVNGQDISGRTALLKAVALIEITRW